jgi:hypothetical protein
MKRKLINVRVSEELQAKFSEMHASLDRDQSETLRELIRAAIRFYDKNGNLYPPWDLVRSEIAGGGVSQSTVVAPVINGHGNHVKTHVRARRK